MGDAPTPTEVITRYVELLGTPDVEGLVDLFADAATVEDPVGAELREGRVALMEFYGSLPATGLTAHLTGPVRAVGNEAAFPFHISTGGVEMDVIDVMTFDDSGKITSMRAFWALG